MHQYEHGDTLWTIVVGRTVTHIIAADGVLDPSHVQMPSSVWKRLMRDVSIAADSQTDEVRTIAEASQQVDGTDWRVEAAIVQRRTTPAPEDPNPLLFDTLEERVLALIDHWEYQASTSLSEGTAKLYRMIAEQLRIVLMRV